MIFVEQIRLSAIGITMARLQNRLKKTLYRYIASHRRVSQMTYQPKSASKMADFETLSLCIPVNSRPVCIYFCKGLSYRVLSVPDKKFDSQLPFIDFITHHALLL